jgi:hypothetical protein
LVACGAEADEQDHARSLRRPLLVSVDQDQVLRELVRYASLAASSHNTQCWTFHLHDRAIVIAPDVSRRCPIVDPDDHHLNVSMGCALENLAHAALATGLQANAHFDPLGSGAITVGLEPTRPLATPLFNAIAHRQCTRVDYDSRPLSNAELQLLERAGSGNGVHLMLLTERNPL